VLLLTNARSLGLTPEHARYPVRSSWWNDGIVRNDAFMNVVVCVKQIPDPATPGTWRTA